MNINPFIGACVEHDHVCIVNEYCSKGSLFDVLHGSDFHFDCRFIASFSTDIAKVSVELIFNWVALGAERINVLSQIKISCLSGLENHMR
jgi:serine/threonine protein kinase